MNGQMLEGITVLSQENIVILGKFHLAVYCIAFSLMFIIMITDSIKNNFGNIKYILCDVIYGIMVSAVAAFIPLMILKDINTVQTGKYEYTVIIDDSVSFTEFTDRYTIIEQNGDVFVIKEK